ncbi:MAG: O-antigen ligase family protein [Pseudomonadota bacterium]
MSQYTGTGAPEFSATKPEAMVVGTLLLIPLAASLVSARTLSFLIVLPLVALIYRALTLPSRSGPLITMTGPAVPALLLSLWAIASALWAANPMLPLEKGALALLYVCASVFMVGQVQRENPLTLRHLGEGVWMGLSLGLAYVAVEMLTDQSVKIFIYNVLGLSAGELTPDSWYDWDNNGRLISVSWTDFTRNAAPISLFMWSAALACLGTMGRGFAPVCSAVIVVVCILIIMASPHETSQLAVLAGIVAFALGRVAAGFMPRLLMVGWLAATLLVVPVALGLYAAGLQTADWVQHSAQGRVIIWNVTAQKTFESPIVGVGANMTREIGPAHDRVHEDKPSEDGTVPMMSIHAHNVFLQTWFELGAVGVGLLVWLGLSLIAVMARLHEVSRPYAYATFASAATMASASYGMWQLWFIALFALTPVIFVVADRVGAQAKSVKDMSATS